MDCKVVEEDLIAYHFGATSEETREAIDAHLVACTDCLKQYLRVKHHLARHDGSASVAERPSSKARARLRAAVAAEFEPSAPARMVRWMRRPIPLYQGLAAAAVVLLVALVAPLVARQSFAVDGDGMHAGGERVDTARPAPESLSFY
jgi:anti-sigma factor RsiW